ncbi:MAG TPA: hypothetical protein PK570_08175 [Thermoanaerobaculia bacterium]|nr:hypothetical protein [Acidobacteriota bacterium]OQC42168.1 MAG: hypothetical protein BWX64_00364 [Acidobacteria bacterium ADurb.Bin051]HNZ96057.1 hypothetical protein [Thermoanaerobaculia bacterium]HQP93916.1 hypothetical protein [Thermoanaerobaculia bacterium]HRS36681.1 hypothetical protein [Thermoanaerobaculia bacterium]
MLSGSDRRLVAAAADGLLPLSLERLLNLQILIAGSGEPEMAARAEAALARMEPRILAAFVTQDAGERELVYLGRHHRHPTVVAAVLRRRDVPRDLLAELAGVISPELQEILILRQDAIVEAPEILDSLERNPRLAPGVQRRLHEYREHLVRAPEPIAPPPDLLDEEDALDAADLAALNEARQSAPHGEMDESTGLTEGQIRSLPVPLRIKLARGASRTLRGILVRDLNQSVARAALNGSAMSEDELEQIASSRAVIEEVLLEVSRHREWITKYRIVLALARNPKTPVAVAVRLVPRLGVRDLKNLAADRNVSDPVRANASRLYKIKAR